MEPGLCGQMSECSTVEVKHRRHFTHKMVED